MREVERYDSKELNFWRGVEGKVRVLISFVPQFKLSPRTLDRRYMTLSQLSNLIKHRSCEVANINM
jgi:hypothetical protein